MTFIYAWLWYLLTPLVPLLWRYRAGLGKEDAARRHERFGRPSQPRPHGTLIWLHGASVGESLSLLAVIDLLRQHNPSWRYVVTTGTVTSAKLMAERLPPEALHQYLPFDHPRYAAQFLRHWQPNGVLWVESDLWPSLLHAVRHAGIPAALLNARMSARSARRWQRLHGFAQKIIGTFSVITAQTPADIARFQPFSAAPVLDVGNLKFVSKPLPADTAKQTELQNIIGTRPVWLMASTHAPEEAMALSLHQQLLPAFPNLLTVIALRHPSRSDAVMAQLGGSAPIYRRSKNEVPPSNGAAVYMCDTLGEMGTLYSVIKTVAMGGSFTVGGHNPIEPAQLGCAIICGPLMYNFTAICAAFDAQQALQHVANEPALATALHVLLQSENQRTQLGQRAAAVCRAQAESLPRVWQAMAPWRTAVTQYQQQAAA